MQIDSLTKRDDFIRLTKHGQQVSAKSVLLQALPQATPSHTIRLGYTASKKMGNAVHRNRIKRRYRAAIQDIARRKNSPLQPNWDYVLVGRHNALERPYEALLKDILYCLHQVKRSHTEC